MLEWEGRGEKRKKKKEKKRKRKKKDDRGKESGESGAHVRFVASRSRPCTVAHSLAGLLATRARHRAIRHSVMSQCYKYSHAFPTNFSVLSRPSRELSAEVASTAFVQRNSPFLPHAPLETRPGRNRRDSNENAPLIARCFDGNTGLDETIGD